MIKKKIHLSMKDMQIQSLGLEDLLEKEMATHSKSHGQRNLVGYSPWGCKSQTRLTDFTFLSSLDLRWRRGPPTPARVAPNAPPSPGS